MKTRRSDNKLGFLSGWATGNGDTFFNKCYHIVGEHLAALPLRRLQLNDTAPAPGEKTLLTIQPVTELEWEIDGFSGLGMDFELCFD